MCMPMSSGQDCLPEAFVVDRLAICPREWAGTKEWHKLMASLLLEEVVMAGDYAHAVRSWWGVGLTMHNKHIVLHTYFL